MTKICVFLIVIFVYVCGQGNVRRFKFDMVDGLILKIKTM